MTLPELLPSPIGRGAGGEGARQRPFDLVIFDLDGTLLDTAPGIADAVNQTLREHGLRETPVAQVAGWIGEGSVTLMRRALAWAGGSLALLEPCAERYVALYRSRANAPPFPGVVDTLEALCAAGVALAVASNKEGSLVEVLLERSGLRCYFGRVLGGDSLPAKKPDPLPLQHCLAHFGVAPERALFVGDSALDLECARRAGVACWLASYGYDAGSAAPDRKIASLAELTSDTPRTRHIPCRTRSSTPPALPAARPR